jgi:hypothetical protein
VSALSAVVLDRPRPSALEGRWLASALYGSLGALIAVHVGVLAYHLALTLAFPYDLNYGEGYVLNDAVRLAHAQPLYVDLQQFPMVRSPYPPLAQRLRHHVSGRKRHRPHTDCRGCQRWRATGRDRAHDARRAYRRAGWLCRAERREVYLQPIDLRAEELHFRWQVQPLVDALASGRFSRVITAFNLFPSDAERAIEEHFTLSEILDGPDGLTFRVYDYSD